MNDTDAATLLSLLTAAWPNQAIPDHTTDLWLGLLAELELNDAKTAAKTVIREDMWFPPISRFLAAVDAAKHARRNREAMLYGLPDPGVRVPDRARFDQIIANLRSQLADRGSRDHDHRGPKPCPVCGGLPVPWDRRTP